MATKSILKEVNLKNKKLAAQFVNTLDRAQYDRGKTVTYSRSVQDMKKDEVKKFFEKK